MTAPADDPDWGLLPDRPMEFFGLESGFDQKALKRKYNGLIRRFKPEKFPLQFQQIRAAFEALNRFFSAPPFQGLPFQVVRMSADEIELAAVETPAGGEQGSAPRPRRAPSSATLLDRVRNTPPEKLHEELRLASAKSRDERLLLAFLDDARNEDSSPTFLDGLLAAVRSHRDEETWHLLRDYLRTAEARSRCAEILERIFFVLASDDVFTLTEPLWDELQRRVPFATFRNILDDCVRHIADHRIAQRLTFEIRLLRRTLFYADADWTAQRLARLTKGDVAWPEWLDRQIWSIEQLVSYAKVRTRFLNGNRLRAMLDDVVQAYCEDAPEFDRLYLSFQHHVLNHPDEAAAAFTKRDAVVLQVVWNVWQFLAEQVDYRFAPHESFDMQNSVNALSSLAPMLKSASRALFQSPRRWGPVAWMIVLAAVLGIPSAFVLQLLTSTTNSPQHANLEKYVKYILFPWFGVVIALVLLLILMFIKTPLELRWRVYVSRMRQALFAFIRRQPLPAAMFLDRLKSYATGSRQADNILAEAQHDFALRFYAAAAWTLR